MRRGSNSASFVGRLGGDRGAVLIHVAVALLGLLAFSVLVIDYGVMWVSRNQAQNAADAAALAAAVSLAYYDADDIPRAKAAAVAAGQANLVWGQAPDIDPAIDVIIPYPCPPGAPGPPDTCVRANVYRNETKDPLPVYFGPLVGITRQGVRAMAVAQILAANASDCIKPFAVPDKWIERRDKNGTIKPPPWDDYWDFEQTYDRYYETGNNKGALLSLVPSELDEYVPPAGDNPGSGFRLPDDYGVKVTLKAGNPSRSISPGWFFPVDLPRADEAPITGGDKYRENIASCNGVPIGGGDVLQVEPGDMIGPTAQGIRDLVAPDPSYWDYGNNAPACPTLDPNCFTRRYVAIPLFNVDAYTTADRTTGRFDLPITRLVGFFIEDIPESGPNRNDVIGHFVPFQGIFRSEGPAPEPSSFLRTVVLVR
jgi:hypothetical protein